MNRLVAIYDSQSPGQAPESPLFSWRLYEDGSWMGPEQTGDLTQLAAAQQQSQAEIWLALASSEIVMQEAHFASKEKRHLSKLLPYELEDEILGDVDDFHFAFGTIHNDRVSVAYTPRDWLAQLLEQFEKAKLEVSVVTPLALMLPWQEHNWSLRWLGEDALVEVRYARELAFCVPLDLLPMALLALKTDQINHEAEGAGSVNQIKLFGQNFEDLQTLQEALPESLQEMATSAQWDAWLSLAIERIPALNLRQQSLGRSLPIARWWLTWRPAAVAAGIAVAMFLGSNWVAEIQLKSQMQEHRVAAEKAFRTVVPSGAMVDPERQLKSQLARYKSTGEESGAGAIELLATVSPILTASADVEVRNLHYVEGEIRLNIESADFRQIDQLRSTLEKQRLLAELLGTTSVAEGTQARLKIRRVQ